MMKRWNISLFVVLAVLAVLLGSFAPSADAQVGYPVVSTIPDPSVSEPSDIVTVPVIIDMRNGADALGEYSITLMWDNSVIMYEGISGGSTTGFTTVMSDDSNIAAGELRISSINEAGATGLVHVADVYYFAGGSPLEVTEVYPDVSSLTAAVSITDLTPTMAIQTGDVTIDTPPTITTESIPDADEDLPYDVTFDVIEPDEGDSALFSLYSAPGWMSIDEVTGQLTGTPTNADVGDAVDVTVCATDTYGLTDYYTYTISVNNVNDPPSITTLSIPDATEETAYAAGIEADDPDPDEVLTFSLTESPGWMTIDPDTGELTGTPAPEDIGNAIEVTVTVMDFAETTDTATFLIDVLVINDPPVIHSEYLDPATQDVLYEFPLDATDLDPADALLYELTQSPAWLTIDPDTGILSGTPGNGDIGAGFPVSVTVTDPRDDFDDAEFTIEVVNVNDPPVINTASIVDARQDEPYSVFIDANDIDPDEVLSFVLDTGPAWLSIDPLTGELSGTPTLTDVGAGELITVTVMDYMEATDSADFVIDVLDVNDPPEIQTAALDLATQDIPYDFPMDVIDPDPDDVMTWTTPISPPWLTIDPDSGVLSGTPVNDDVGTGIPVTVRVTDIEGLYDEVVSLLMLRT